MYKRSPLDHPESIYALIPPAKKEVVKPPMHKSKYPGNAAPSSSTFGRATVTQIPVFNVAGDYEVKPSNHRYKQEGAVMGRGSHNPKTTAYLKKNTKPSLPEAKQFSYTQQKKAALDTKGITIKPKQTNKNFIKENALKVIMAKPTTRDNGGPDFMAKEDYGKVPAYLKEVKKEIEDEQEYIRTIMMQEQEAYTAAQPKMRLLSEEDRLSLLDQLKTKWDAVDKQYQLQTHVVDLDTIGKVRRKEEYESQLQNLEKMIEKLERKNVFVQEDFSYDMFM